MARLIGFIFILIACRPSKSRIKADNFNPWKEFARKGDILIACKADSCKSRKSDGFYKYKVKDAKNSDLLRVKFPNDSNKALSFEGVVNKLEVWRKKTKNSKSISVAQLDSDYSKLINQLNKTYEHVNVYDLSNALIQNNFNPGIFCDKQLEDL